MQVLSAILYFKENNLLEDESALIIVPPTLISNWENEIKIHFDQGTIPYYVFHGRNRGSLTKEQILTATVILTTYEMVGTSGNPSHTNQITIESLDISWFRIVLDEAQ